MSDPKKFKLHSKVAWKWMGRFIHGKVISIHTEPITKSIKGKNIKRNGSTQNPAYVVESEAGNQALKLQTELLSFAENTSKTAKEPKANTTNNPNKKTNLPKMFS